MIYLLMFREAVLLGLQTLHKYLAYRMRDVAVWLIHHSEPVIEHESELVYVIFECGRETDAAEIASQEVRS